MELRNSDLIDLLSGWTCLESKRLIGELKQEADELANGRVIILTCKDVPVL